MNLDPGIYKTNIGIVLLNSGTLQIKIEHSINNFKKISNAIERALHNFIVPKEFRNSDVEDVQVFKIDKNKHFVLSQRLNETIYEIMTHEKSETIDDESNEIMIFKSLVKSEDNDVTRLSMDFLPKRPGVNRVYAEYRSNIESSFEAYEDINDYYDNMQLKALKKHKHQIDMAIKETKLKLGNGYVRAFFTYSLYDFNFMYL